MQMQAQIRELHAPAVAAGIAVLGGVAAWQWGVELERAWLRCEGGPLPGDPLGPERREQPRQPEADDGPGAASGNRRWVSRHSPAGAPAAPRLARR
jgi:hypothetical protein